MIRKRRLLAAAALTGAATAATALGTAWSVRAAWRRLQARDLAGRVVLITGGSRGLGLLLAREFARHRCRLALCTRDQRELERARAELVHTGAAVEAVVCDVARRDQVEALVARATARFGRIDVLVNNAGIIQVDHFKGRHEAEFSWFALASATPLTTISGRRAARHNNQYAGKSRPAPHHAQRVGLR